MMNDDEDDVLGIDLDAWQPPPPPASTADAVIARMRRENTAVTAQALPVETAAPMSKRWWLVAGLTVAIAATSVITFALTRDPRTARGITAGDRAAHISIGSSSANVDAYTVVSWRREGERITAKQAGGGATWHVDDDDTLTIETGLTSIEATSASLRVEVKMLDQKKMIALSAVTAAAVAVVTVVVYEGVVKAGDKTVAPGTSYQITNKGENVIEEEELAVGASPDLVRRVTELEAELAAKQAEIERLKVRVVLPACDFDELQEKGEAHYSANRPAEALVFFERAYACDAKKPNTLKYVTAAACKSKNLMKARFYWKRMNEEGRHAIASLCAGYGIVPADLDVKAPELGRLQVSNIRPATVLLDGVSVGMTPIDLEVPPGKHKVTLVVGVDKHSFAVNVKVGETTTLHKQLDTLE
ncbi:MAG: PEGA domain-containing protein [Myxococcota bacterium]|nr:PEGA domain-containing protein [Myxococcota bacterium]